MLVEKDTETSEVLSALRYDDLEMEEYINQLETLFNAREPSVLAFVPEDGRFDRLRSEAQDLVSKYPHPDTRPDLFGLVIGVKDIFHADGFVTRAGSRVPPKALQGEEAESVTLLKKAGALVMGKTVTTEFAYFAPGPTRNPHNLAHTPGGSSSGSAAAVAARLVPLAFGTQTIGSITRPASYCGVVGYKPSYDRISRKGVIPLSPSVDHVGLFTAEVETAELAARNLVKEWIEPGDLKNKPVLGIPEGPYLDKAGKEIGAHFTQVLARIREAGFEIKPIKVMTDIEDIIQRHNLIVAAEAAQTHHGWYSKYHQVYHPKTTDLIERGQDISAGALSRALEGRDKLRSELTSLMKAEEIDLWLSPGAPGPAPRGLESTGDPVMNLPWTHCGLPTLNLPSGLSLDGLPMGLQVAAGWYEDEKLFPYGARLAAILY
jgi:Asp-tRNA(Asn)/Glu-tRNA(Gln) amidotransferase A subunit family amidase